MAIGRSKVVIIGAGNVVLRDRQHLAEDGIMIVVLGLDGATDQLITGPDIVSRGFVYVKTSDELMDEAREVVTLAVEGCLDRGITDWGKLKNQPVLYRKPSLPHH